MPRDIASATCPPLPLARARIGHRPLRRPALLSRLVALCAVARQRRQLAKLEPHRLADLGLTREQALEEAKRGFWDAPSHWRL